MGSDKIDEIRNMLKKVTEHLEILGSKENSTLVEEMKKRCNATSSELRENIEDICASALRIQAYERELNFCLRNLTYLLTTIETRPELDRPNDASRCKDLMQRIEEHKYWIIYSLCYTSDYFSTIEKKLKPLKAIFALLCQDGSYAPTCAAQKKSECMEFAEAGKAMLSEINEMILLDDGKKVDSGILFQTVRLISDLLAFLEEMKDRINDDTIGDDCNYWLYNVLPDWKTKINQVALGIPIGTIAGLTAQLQKINLEINKEIKEIKSLIETIGKIAAVLSIFTKILGSIAT